MDIQPSHQPRQGSVDMMFPTLANVERQRGPSRTARVKITNEQVALGLIAHGQSDEFQDQAAPRQG